MLVSPRTYCSCSPTSSQDSIDRRLGNLETTRDRDFAQASLGLDVAEKRGGSSWHVHAHIPYSNDQLSMRDRVACRYALFIDV